MAPQYFDEISSKTVIKSTKMYFSSIIINCLVLVHSNWSQTVTCEVLSYSPMKFESGELWLKKIHLVLFKTLPNNAYTVNWQFVLNPFEPKPKIDVTHVEAISVSL